MDSKIDNETSNVLKVLNRMLNIHNELLNIYIESDEYNKINYEKFEKNIYLFVEKLIKIKHNEMIDCIFNILIINKIYNLDVFKHLKIINLFLDKKYKKGMSDIILKKLNSNQHKDYLLNEIEEIYVNWLSNNKK